MSFLNIKINHVRNIGSANAEFSQNLNVIFGNNGSGKSSFLESLYLLATARSFRTRKLDSLVNRNDASSSLVVFGEINNKHGEILKVGVRKSVKDGTSIKVNGVLEKSAAELAKHLPVLALDPGCFKFLEGGSKIRRQFLDWGVFHVEHTFARLWSDYNNCLKHRNALLRSRNTDTNQLSVWGSKLSELAKCIDLQRVSYYSVYEENLKTTINDLFPEIQETFQVNYYRGWDNKKNLESVLIECLEQDTKRKHTYYGAHRSDLRLSVAGKPLEEVLSRGQQKKLIVSVYLAHITTVKHLTRVSPVVLLDDITAELDEINSKKVIQYLLKLESQVFCSILERESLGAYFSDQVDDYKMFHVEHGLISLYNK